MINLIDEIKKLFSAKRKENDENTEPRKYFGNPDDLFDELGVYELSIDCGEDFLPFVDELSGRIWDLRLDIKKRTGFILPPVHILDKTDLQENEIRINVRDNTVFTDYLVPTEENFCDEIIRNLEIICFEYLEEIFSNEIVEKYIEHVNINNCGLVAYLTRVIPVPGFKKIFTDIIRNGKSINDITMIFEKIAEAAMTDNDTCFTRDAKKISKEVLAKLNI